VDLYIHNPIRLHGVVLYYLSTGTTLPFFLPYRVAEVPYRMPELNSNQQRTVNVIKLNSNIIEINYTFLREL
jgi:hypothetical protein